MSSAVRNFISPVSSIAEIETNIVFFNREACENQERSHKILVATTYWLYDAKTTKFAPSKFVGYRGMDFETYNAALTAGVEGARFDGSTAREAIEACCQTTFIRDSGLVPNLIEWAEMLLFAGVFKSVNKRKWKFLSLSNTRAVGVRRHHLSDKSRDCDNDGKPEKPIRRGNAGNLSARPKRGSL